jgi:aspartyl/asparaginyl beta-hydroxylase (cupin superfamily)
MASDKYFWPSDEKLVYVRPPKEEYHGGLDFFYKPEIFPELNVLKQNWEGIRDEILAFEKKNGALSGMSTINPANVYGGNWTVIYLMSFLWKFHRNRARFPFTTKILDQIPNAVFAAISILPPNTEIAPHYGDTNGIVRAHLGLIVPAAYPTIAIRVGTEEMGWKEGELLCFINVQRHSVWNRSTQKRYVLMIDFVPEALKSRTMEICSKGLGSQSFNYLHKKLALVRMLPLATHNWIAAVFTIFWRLYLPIQRKFGLL